MSTNNVFWLSSAIYTSDFARF